MVDKSRFNQAFDAFFSAPFPGRQQRADLENLRSDLFMFDAFVTGDMSRVRGGHAEPWEILDIEGYIDLIVPLGRSLELIQSSSDDELLLLEGFRSYVALLEKAVGELKSLSCRDSQ